MAECIHELSPADCSDCSGRGQPERGPWFGARYDGFCSGCGDDFEAGDRIRADGEGGYLCWECGP